MGASNFHTPIESATAFFRGGFLSLLLIFICLSTMVETHGQIAHINRTSEVEPVRFLYPVKEAIALIFVDVAFTVFCQLIFSASAFSLAEERASVAQVISFLIYTFLTALCIKLFFRAIAAFASDGITYYTLAVLFSIFGLLYAGFAVPLPSLDTGRKVGPWLNVSKVFTSVVYSFSCWSVAFAIQPRGAACQRVPWQQDQLFFIHSIRSCVYKRVTFESSL